MGATVPRLPGLLVIEQKGLAMPVARRFRRPLPAWVPLVAAAAIAGAGALPGGAAEPAKKPANDTFYETFNVAVANVEVVVTDRQGRPVAGLTQDDFELYEDGKRVPLTNFFAQSEEVGEPTASPGPGPRGAAAPPPPGADRSVVIFVDNHNLEPSSRRRVFEKLRPFLLEMSPRDRIVFAVHDQTLKMSSMRPTDRAELEKTLAEINGSSTGGIDQRTERDILIREIERADNPILLDGVYAGIRIFAERRLHEVRATLKALEQAVDTLAGLPGYKVVLYVSSGLPLRPAESLLRLLEEELRGSGFANPSNPLEAFTFDATPDLRTLIAKANASRVTFYAVGAPNSESAVEARSLLVSQDFRAFEEQSNLAAMLDLAGATGGTAVADPNDPGQLLTQIRRDMTTYYSLGYAPTLEKQTGKIAKNRTIKVKVRGEGLTVRYRETLRPKDGIEIGRERLWTTLMLAEGRNPLGIDVHFAKTRVIDRKGTLEAEVTVEFPLERLTLLPTDAGQEGMARLYIASRDRRGNVSPVTEIAIPIKVPKDRMAAALKQKAGYRTKLRLHPDPGFIAFALRDEIGNQDSSILVPYAADASLAPKGP